MAGQGNSFPRSYSTNDSFESSLFPDPNTHENREHLYSVDDKVVNRLSVGWRFGRTCRNNLIGSGSTFESSRPGYSSQFSYSPTHSPPRLMAGINANQPPNPPNPPPAWKARSPLNLTPPLHDLPHDFEKILPKFDPSEKVLVDDHLQSFYLAIE